MKRKILVVEDSFEVRVALEMGLSQEGYDPRVCPDGESGWEEFKQFEPDLALLDIRMPGMNGIELCRLIRESSNVPVIMFSAIEDKAEKLDAFEAGADDYVIKGTGIDELLIRVAAQLRWRREVRKEDDESDSSPKPAEENLDVDNDQLSSVLEVGQSLGQSTRTTSKKKAPPKHPRMKVPAFDGKAGTTIVVSDPNHNDRERLVRFLERQGEKVIETEYGIQTLMTVGKYLPWLVITELVMPDLNGTQVLKVLSEHPRTVDVATMVVSSKGSPEARAIANRYGALDFIVKPWSEDEISLRIEWAKQSLQRRKSIRTDNSAA